MKNPLLNFSDEQLETQLETIVCFLSAVHPTLTAEHGYKPCVEIRPIPRSTSKKGRGAKSFVLWDFSEGTRKRLISFLKKWNGHQVCFYYSVYSFDNQKMVARKDTGELVRASSISNETALSTNEIALDFDHVSYDDYKQLVDRFEKLDLYAWWVYTGHGYQAHILLESPISNKNILRQLVYKFRSKGFDCDPVCVDPARVMRLPGTYNCKCFVDETYAAERSAPPLCYIAQQTPVRYTVEAVFQKLDCLETVNPADEEEFYRHSPKTAQEESRKKVAPKGSRSSSTDPVGVQDNDIALSSYPYLDEFELPEPVMKMLAYTPHGYRNNVLGFLVGFFKAQYGLGKQAILAIMDLWAREACEPAYDPVEFKTDFDRLYYNYNGLPYTPKLAQQFGYIDFKEQIILRKKDIHIPVRLFQDLESLDCRTIRLYLAIKLMEHTEELPTQESLAKLLGISDRALRPIVQDLVKTRYGYLVKGNSRNGIPNSYRSSRFVESEGFMTFSYNDIRAYLSDIDSRNANALKLYLFFRYKFYSGDIYMSQDNIGKHIGSARNTISDLTQKLEALRFIKIHKIAITPFMWRNEYVLLR